MSALLLEQEIEYPTSDGQPMAETPEHVQAIFDLLHGLQRRYVTTPDVWVGANFFLFYERGNPKARVSPDVMLAKGVAPRGPAKLPALAGASPEPGGGGDVAQDPAQGLGTQENAIRADRHRGVHPLRSLRGLPA